ncbi:MAG: signal peptidase I [Bowdeniella nasicola]|nr:signal peptidase I [Bowdeniella nasicola]
MADEPLVRRRSITPTPGDDLPPSFPPRHLRPRPTEPQGFGGWLKELVVVVIIALFLSFIVKTFLVQSFYIPSESMDDTLAINDRILVNKTISAEDINRGDIVVFKDPGGWLPERMEQPSALRRLGRDTLIALGILPVDAGEHLIKRVIGLPGDRVSCCSDDGAIEINGVPVPEPYLKPDVEPSLIDFDVVVPPGHVWLMGDNRSSSLDARAHIGEPGGGFVPMDDVVGRAFVVIWPYERWGSLAGGDEYFSHVPAP